MNNYDAREIAIWFNESVTKAAEEECQVELRQQIEAEVTQRLTRQFTRQLAEKEAAVEQKLAAERKIRQKELKTS